MVQTQDNSEFNQNPLVLYVDTTSSGITWAANDAIQITGFIDNAGTTTGPSQYMGVFQTLDVSNPAAVICRLRSVPSNGPISTGSNYFRHFVHLYIIPYETAVLKATK